MAGVKCRAASGTEEQINNDEDLNDQFGQPILQLAMPTASHGPSTFAYQQALSNRFDEDRLRRGERFDTKAYTPTFVHDILMLPGSLASLIGKDSAATMVRRMTPALLPGFHARVHHDTQQPYLTACTCDNDDNNDDANCQHAQQGMLIFGLGRTDRQAINQHYRTFAKRKKMVVEVDLMAPSSHDDAAPGTQRKNCARRRAIHAHVWRWRSSGGGGGSGGDDNNDGDDADPKGNMAPVQVKAPFAQKPHWTLEGYLRGEFELPQTQLRIEEDAKGDEDEDGFIGHEARERETAPAWREKVRSGPGTLAWKRADHFTGW